MTHGGAARCSFDEIEALDWNFQQIWAGLVYDGAVQRKAGNGWRKLMGQLSENSYFDLLGLLGRDSRGMKDDFSWAESCWANDARSWSCQGRAIAEPKVEYPVLINTGCSDMGGPCFVENDDGSVSAAQVVL